MQTVTIAFLSFIRPTFDVELAQALTEEARHHLTQAGYHLVGPVEAITALEQAVEAASELSEQAVDLLVIYMATFNDSTMITTIATSVSAPLLLWALPEPGGDDRLRLNSLCGINLSAHALTKLGRKYDYIYAKASAAAVLDRVAVLACAGRAQRLLKQGRIARVGERPSGFETCDYDDDKLLSRLGVEVVPIDLNQEVFPVIRQTEQVKIEQALSALSQQVEGLEAIDDNPKRRTISTYITLNEIAQEKNLHGFAVRCWPEFFSEMECAACAAMSMLSNQGLPSSCEADVHGTITQLILQSMSGQPAFGTDLVSIVENEDAIALWHCGLAPLGMANEAKAPRVTNHVGRKLPLLMDFALKPGVVTVARLNEQQNGDFRLVVGRAEMLDRPKPYHGTSGMMRFGRPASAVIDILIREGLEHHVAITYGDYVDPLLVLAELLDMPTLRL